MASNRETFYKLSALYFDNNIVREIYCTESFSICNLANQCYVLFIYPHDFASKTRASKTGVCGLLIRAEDVKAIVKDNSYIQGILAWDKKTFMAHAVLLNEKNYLKFKSFKDKNDLNGPTSSIDLAMEEEIRNKGRSK